MKPKDCKKCGLLCDKFIRLYPYDVRPTLKLENTIIRAPCNSGQDNFPILIQNNYITFSDRIGFKQHKTLKAALNFLFEQNYLTLEETITLTKYKNLIFSSSYDIS